MKKKEKVVLAYSGGLDTSVIIPWLIENYHVDVVAFAADVGQSRVETANLKKKAVQSGAKKCIVKNLRAEFARDYIWPTLKAGAKYEDAYLLGTSMARPVIAKHQVLVAKQEKAWAVAHGATGKGNDQVRFELAYMALAPELQIIAPWKDKKWDMHSREDAIDYAKRKNIPLGSISKKKIYSEDGNLWHLSHEGGNLEYVDREHSFEMLSLSVPPEKAPSRPGYVKIGFKKGEPVSLNNRPTSPVTLIEKLNKEGGRHGCGLLDMVENRLVGIKSRGVYETPGGALLYKAHEALESLVLDRNTLQYKQGIARKYAQLVYDGLWFTPLRSALDKFVDETQQVVTGQVTLKIYKGNITPVKMESPFSLYNPELGGFSDSEFFNQKDAQGFIHCLGLPLKTRAMLHSRKKRKS